MDRDVLNIPITFFEKRWDRNTSFSFSLFRVTSLIVYLTELNRDDNSHSSGTSCSKLTMSLVNDSLKFTWSDTQIC